MIGSQRKIMIWYYKFTYYSITCCRSIQVFNYYPYYNPVWLGVPWDPRPYARESHARCYGYRVQRVRARETQNLPAGHPCPSLTTTVSATGRKRTASDIDCGELAYRVCPTSLVNNTSLDTARNHSSSNTFIIPISVYNGIG